MSVDSYPVRRIGPQTVISLPGEIDATNAGQLRKALDRALADGAKVLVADMTGTTFCASDGVHVLVQARTAANETGAELRLAAPGRAVRQVLQLTAADHVLDPYPSLEEALAGPGGRR